MYKLLKNRKVVTFLYLVLQKGRSYNIESFEGIEQRFISFENALYIAKEKDISSDFWDLTELAGIMASERNETPIVAVFKDRKKTSFFASYKDVFNSLDDLYRLGLLDDKEENNVMMFALKDFKKMNLTTGKGEI